jgi:hypothetical protein
MTKSNSNANLPFHHIPALFLHKFKVFLAYQQLIIFVFVGLGSCTAGYADEGAARITLPGTAGGPILKIPSTSGWTRYPLRHRGVMTGTSR